MLHGGGAPLKQALALLLVGCSPHDVCMGECAEPADSAEPEPSNEGHYLGSVTLHTSSEWGWADCTGSAELVLHGNEIDGWFECASGGEAMISGDVDGQVDTDFVLANWHVDVWYETYAVRFDGTVNDGQIEGSFTESTWGALTDGTFEVERLDPPGGDQ
jgi:hypothetical protein